MADELSGQSPFKEEVRQFVEETGVVESAEEILGPFSDLAGRVADALYDAVLPGPQTNSLYWPLLVLTLLISAAFFVLRKGRGAKGADGRERACGILSYLLPRSIYTHKSARVDVWLYLIDRGLMPV